MTPLSATPVSVLRILRAAASRGAPDAAARRRRLGESVAILRAARRSADSRVEVDDRGARLVWRREDGGRCMVSAISLAACAEARAAVMVGVPLIDARRLRRAPDLTDGRDS